MAKQQPTAISAQAAVDPDDALKILIQLAGQVAGLHQQGQLHRAISAESGSYGASRAVTLSPPSDDDVLFGGAQTDEERCPPELRTSQPIGIPKDLFLARRLLGDRGVPLDPVQIDVYQLGTLLCRLLTGEPIQSYLCSPRTKGRVPSALQPMIERAIGYGSERFTEARQMADALRQQLADSQPPTELDVTSADSAVAGQDVSEETPVVTAADDTSPSIVSLAPERDTSIDSRPVSVPPADGEELPFDKLGHYEIIERIGRGGMGDVYKAYERALDRTVAIKVLPAEFSRDDEFVKRFYAEATAAARLSHPNIIDVYFIGEDQGRHFFSMQFVDGDSLAHLLSQNNRLSVEQSLPIVTQTLAGLAAAHRQGMVHRDIKPGNILIDRENRRCLVADFGLVKMLQGSKHLTATGTVMGTVDYISPEQGKGQPVDARSDLYSVGVLLYRMLSGQLPFQADSPTAMIFQHVYEQPTPLKEVAPAVPPVLSAIVEKLLAKAPDERYASATGVLSDLRAFRENNPLPSGADVVSLDGDDPGIVALDEAPLSIIIEAPQFDQEPELPEDLDAVVPTGMWGRLRNRLIDAVEERAPEFLGHLQNTQQQVDRAVDVYERRQNGLRQLVTEAEAVLADFQAQAQSWQEAAKTAEDQAAFAENDEKAREHLRAKIHSEQSAAEIQQQINQQQEQLSSIRLRLSKATSTLERLRSQRDLLNARLKVARARFQMAGGKVRGRRLRVLIHWLRPSSWPLPVQVTLAIVLLGAAGVLINNRINRMESDRSAFPTTEPAESVDETTPVAVTKPPELSESPGPPRMPLLQFVGHEGSVASVSFSPDGRLMASGSSDHTIRLWDTQSGQNVKTFRNVMPDGGTQSVGVVCFSHNGQFLASGSSAASGNGEGALKIWNAAAGVLARTFLGATGLIKGLAFSPDDQVLFAIHWEGMGTTENGKRRILGPTENKMHVRHWDLATGKELRRLEVKFDKGAFSQDGAYLATHRRRGDNSIHLWNAVTGAELRTLNIPQAPDQEPDEANKRRVFSLAFNPDGSILASRHADGTVILFNTKTGRIVRQFGLEYTVLVSFNPNGTRLITSGRAARGEPSGVVRIWDIGSGRVRATLRGQLARSVAFHPDGSRLVTGGSNPFLLMWDAKVEPLTVSKEARYIEIKGGKMITRTLIDVSTESSRLLFGGGKTIGVWDFRAEKLREFERFTGSIESVALSSDGRIALSGGRDGLLCLWDVENGKLLRRVNLVKPEQTAEKLDLYPTGGAFFPDNRHVLVGTPSRIFLWDVQTGEELPRFQGALHGNYSMALSPDGRYAVTGSWSRAERMGDLRLWDVETGKPVRWFVDQLGQIRSVAFSSDGTRLLSGGNGVMQLWDVETGDEIRRFKLPTTLRSIWGTPEAKAVAFSPNGRRAVSSGYGMVSLWDVSSGEELLRFQKPKLSGKDRGRPRTFWEKDVAFSPNGRYVISAGDDGIRLWDTVVEASPSKKT